MHILHLPTGGTVDAERYADPEYPPEFATIKPISPVAFYLRDEAKKYPGTTVSSLPICRRDSKLLTKGEKQLLCSTILDMQRKVGRIVPTTGTDAMPEIGRMLHQSTLHRLCVPVVLTGAVKAPLANGTISDGWFNAARAAFGLPDLEPKVYIAIGPLVEEAIYVRKDFERQAFYSIRGGGRRYAL